MFGHRHLIILPLFRTIEILHPDRPRKILFQSVEDVLSGELLESRTRGIKVPILILEVSSWCL
jgi:hypothetical protein